MHIQEVTITKAPKVSGSNAIRWNVDLDGRPFGQIWTFKNTKTDTHRFHVATLGRPPLPSFATYAEAERALRGQM
jgi:hypothetical protein